MRSEIKNIIEKELGKYEVKEIRISGKEYSLYLIPELCDEDLNIFEGFLFVEAENKTEVSYLKSKYRPPVSGYAPRIGLIFYDNHLLIRDYRKNRYIVKTIEKINKTFIKKLKKALREPSEENFNKLFDRTDIIEEFYILFKKSREYLLKNITGISEEEKREEFVDNFMMQMLTLWYLQERGFFNEDTNYFITKFKELRQRKLVGGFKSYYEFLTYLFEKISGNVEGQYYEDEVTGKVVVVGPAVFLNGDGTKAVSIPDKCFYKEGMTSVLINTPPKKVSDEVPLLNLFESRDWTEGNIDEFVLGAIYEKLITYMERKKLGAYYTPEEITSYICKNTIEPYLVEKINEKFNKDFETIDQIIESNEKSMILHLFEELKEIKILDPAVGSGHFLESAINVLVSIYEKIQEKARELNIKKGLEIITTDEKGKIKTINLLEISDDEFKLLIKFFIILSKNIYGVDISPSALKVAKARLFLTLAKHFKVGKGKDIFIRFPNVHFNLREGNSLIGYVGIEKEKPKRQLQLDLFIKEDQAEYMTERIKVLSELRTYLENTAKALKIDGNIVREVEDLNKILAKKKISWNDLEKVLRTKEKLIRILIASLNSQYAVPLNNLLREITDLFNQRLDEKFAEEHNIDLEKLKKAKSLPWERKMFHWVFEFPEVFLRKNPGFDVVVGNPPYIMEVRDNSNLFEIYKYSPIGRRFYEQKMDIFYFFIERGLELLKDNGLFGYIVQEYWLTRTHAKKLRKEVFTNSTPLEFILFREFKVFKGAPGQHNMIIILKNRKPTPDDKVLVKDLRNVADDSIVYANMCSSESNEIFEVFIENVDKLYDSQNDKVTLVGGLDGEVLDKIYENAVFLNPKEIQIGVDVHQYFVTKKHVEKSGNYTLKEGEGIFVLSEEEFQSYSWTDYELKLLKPFYFAAELDKYFHPLKNKYWLIYTDKYALREIKNHPSRYPHIISHLDKFKDIITSDHKPYGLHRPRQPEWFESKNKIIGVRKTKYPKFAVVNVPFYTDQATIIIKPTQTMPDVYYLVSILNSSLGHWIFLKTKTQGNQLQIDKEVLKKFPLRINAEFFFIRILSRYHKFLKQYQNYFAKEDKHLQYIIDYFDNLIDCLVYELYLGDVVKVPIKEFVENKLDDIDLPENLLNTGENKRKEILNKIENVFKKLESDKKLNENLYLIKLHPWVKTIYKALER